ncbi:hypothetical protein SEVIR_3G341466v4 [Setaria viridis]
MLVLTSDVILITNQPNSPARPPRMIRVAHLHLQTPPTLCSLAAPFARPRLLLPAYPPTPTDSRATSVQAPPLSESIRSTLPAPGPQRQRLPPGSLTQAPSRGERGELSQSQPSRGSGAPIERRNETKRRGHATRVVPRPPAPSEHLLPWGSTCRRIQIRRHVTYG